MRIVDDELKRLMEEYRFFHEIRKASAQLEKEKDSNYQKEQKRKINRENAKRRIKEEQWRYREENLAYLSLSSEERRKIILKNQEEKKTKKKKTSFENYEYKKPVKNNNKKRKHITDYKWNDKYSGIEAQGDSGRAPRKEDWNDEIALNFQRELGKARMYRNQGGLNGVDRGALK